MREIPITADSPQEFTIDYKDQRLTFTLIFLPVAKTWLFDLFNEDKQFFVVQGFPLVVETPILYRNAVDYVLIVDDLSGRHIDPFSLNCMGNRCKLYIEDKTEIDKTIQQAI